MFKERNKTKRRGLAMAILLFLLTLTSFATATYAWWNNLQKNEDVVVEVGERVVIVANEETGFNFGSGLVPEGTVLINGQVSSATGEIKVVLTGIDETRDDVKLTVKHEVNDLLETVFDISYDKEFLNVKNETIRVAITIKLKADQSLYTSEILDLLVNKEININFIFELVPSK